MVAVAVVLISLALKSWSSRQAAAAAPAQALQPAAGADGSQAPVEGRSSYGTVIDRVNDMKTKVGEVREEGSQATGDFQTEPGPSRPVAAAPDAVPAPVAKAPPAPPPVVAEAPEDSDSFSLWPRITLNGILSKGTQGRGIAIVNNQMMSVNESIEGVRLLEVRSNGVLMEFGGESRFVETGQTLQ
ncbi:MAG TPA: hypothetical protein VIH35_06120 [Kiritimatiellia bacterium]|jgi:hypothetical protein